MRKAVYKEWVSHIFNHEVTDPEWYWGIESPFFEADDETIVELIAQCCENYSRDLARFSNGQLNQGFNYIFSSGASDYAFSIKDGKVPWELKRRAIESLKVVLEDCFDKRCEPTRSSEEGNELNYICFMLWDVTPFAYCAGCADEDLLYESILDVMEFGLYLGNPAVIYGSLHGLGHIKFERPREVEGIIDKFLAVRSDLQPELIEYAQAARTGYIM